MSLEKKKSSYEDWTEFKERKKLQGVSWNGWKPTLYKHLTAKGYKNCKKEFEDSESKVDSLLHEWFILRRMRKMNMDVEEKISKFIGELDNEHSEIFGKPEVVEAFKFITEKTETLREDILIKQKR